MSAGEQQGRKPRADVQRNRPALLSAPRFWPECQAARLVDDTGFGPYDTSTLADSWRQQPNSPAYCTELTLDELPAVLAAAIHDSLPERLAAFPATATLEDVVGMNRAAYR